MLTLLFNPVSYYVMAGVAGLAILGILLGHFPALRWIFATAFVFVVMCSAVYSTYQLNVYYSAKGGLYGYIKELVVRNEAKKVGELSFDLSSLNLTATVNENEYSALFYEDSVLRIDNDKTYGIFINNIPCSNIVFEEDHLSGYFTYTFVDYDENVVAKDTLSFRVSLYDNFTSIFVRNNTGGTYIKYWNSYINKNGFQMDIKPFGYTFSDNDNIRTA